jgi:putative membrane protein
MQDMVKDHQADVAEFNKASTTAKDSDVKTFAAQTLPTLEDHLKQARQVAKVEMSPEHAKRTSTAAATNPKQ